VLAINVSGINEEEAGALNGHGAPVKNDYGAEDAGRRIDTLLARGRGGICRGGFVRGNRELLREASD